MAINISQNYDQFYKGTEQMKSYGSGGEGLTPKDTLVKYEFNTMDEQGNKVMDPMSKEDALHVMKEISGQYGDNVLVEFSGDGLAALSQSIIDQVKKGGLELTEEQKAERAQKQALFEQSIVHLENTHRLLIPNIQTNEKLYGSLEKAPEQIVKAANGVIKNYLLPHDVSGMTEEQRREQIAFGLEEAKYLAANYLDEQHAGEFVSAMETIARYGMNGVVSEDGKVTYHIERGSLVGDYVSQNDILKEKAPELYAELHELNQRIAKGETGWGKKFMELQNRIQQVMDSASGMVSQGRMLTNYEAAAEKYKNWKKTVEDTNLPDTFADVKYADLESFFESLKSQQSGLDEAWFAKAQERFAKWLETE